MNKLATKTLCLYLLSLFSLMVKNAWADYQSGLDAYNKGQFAAASEAWAALAESGDPKAQHGMGLLYENGQGVVMDLGKAAHFYQLAAEQHFPPALNNLAMLYAQGAGVPKDDHKALELWEKAAKGGNSSAQLNLGNLYAQGLGVTRDDKKAVEYWQMAAESSNAQAQYNLGLFHYKKGDDASLKTAIDYFRNAADAGLAQAQYALGEMTREGKGVAIDKNQAGKWYQAAAEKGLKDAVQRLTELKQEGIVIAPPETSSANAPSHAAASHPTALNHSEGLAEPSENEKVMEVPAGASETQHLEATSAAKQAAEQATESATPTPLKASEQLREGIAQIVEVMKPTYRIWLASKNSEEEAKTEWLKVNNLYAPLLGQAEPQYRHYDLGEKGLVIRLFAGTFKDRAEADKLCEELMTRDKHIFCRSVLN